MRFVECRIGSYQALGDLGVADRAVRHGIGSVEIGEWQDAVFLAGVDHRAHYGTAGLIGASGSRVVRSAR